MELILITAGVLVVVIGLAVMFGPSVFKGVIEGQINRRAEAAVITAADPLLKGLSPGRPALVYFTADWCGPCKLAQTPVIQRLMSDYGDRVQLLTVDLDKNPEAAKRWGVMSAPRTFILTPELEPHTTNLDVVYYAKLKEQVEAASAV